MNRRTVEVTCLVDIEETADSLHAHAIPDGIDIRPGDTVTLRNAPSGIGFGDHFQGSCRATVHRAGWLERLWIRATMVLELTELYEVGFAAGEIK